ISHSVKKGILSVAQDETRHANYLYEALHRRLSAAKAAAVIDEWRTRKVEALWAMVGNFIERNGQTRTLVQDGAPTDTTDEVELAEVEAA
ncbi:MAG: rubrerythrin family protein, partial [Phototrophicales bacterium]